MTDDEARDILKSDRCDGWVSWDQKNDAPDWNGGSVTLDGYFSAEALTALLHFFPKD